MAELTEARVKEMAEEGAFDARVKKLVREELAAAKPRLKGPPSLLSKHSKKILAQKKS